MLGRVSFASAVASVPQPTQPAPPIPVQNVTEPEPGKKKKKKLSKTERLAKREAAAYKKIYGPKDAHISLISAAELEKFTKNSQSANLQIRSTPKTKVLCEEDFPSFLPASSATLSNARPGSIVKKPTTAVLEDEFPALLSSNKSKENGTKSAVPPSSTPVIEKNDEEPSRTQTEEIVPSSYSAALEFSSSQAKLEEVSTLAELAKPSNAVEPVLIVGKKKFKKPMLISLDDLLSQTKQSDDQPKKLKGKSKLMVLREVTQSPLAAIGKAPAKKTVGNLLDSTGPVLINRGKIRENPKKKKLTRLKKAILVTRQARSNVSAISNSTTLQSSDVDGSTNPVCESDVPTKAQALVTADLEKSDHLPSESQTSGVMPKSTRYSASSLSSGAALESTEEDSDLVKLLNAALEEQKQESLSLVNQTVIEADKYIEKDNSDFYGDIDEDLFMRTKSAIHTKKFRSYCNMYVSKELHGHVMNLLKELHRFQDRLYHMDPIKYQVKKRFVHGLKNVISYLQINKVVLVIMAPDIEANPAKGGLDEQVSKILSQSKEKHVPVIFSGNRFILGKPIFIKTQVSAIAILDRQGADEMFRKVLEAATELQTKYRSDFYAKADLLKLPS